MRRNKLEALKAKTVARGATPAEAKAAAAKVRELSQDEQRAEARAILLKLGWSENQASGIVTGLDTMIRLRCLGSRLSRSCPSR
jgi:hypothetical protein